LDNEIDSATDEAPMNTDSGLEDRILSVPIGVASVATLLECCNETPGAVAVPSRGGGVVAVGVCGPQCLGGRLLQRPISSEHWEDNQNYRIDIELNRAGIYFQTGHYWSMYVAFGDDVMRLRPLLPGVRGAINPDVLGTQIVGYLFGLEVHYALLFPVTVFLPTLWMFTSGRRLLRRRYQRMLERRGRCPSCGYDLRATLGRCPECGTIPSTARGSAT
jgi:hypothetical protein